MVHGCSQQHHDPVQGLQVERHELRRPCPLHLRDEMRSALNMIHHNQKFTMDKINTLDAQSQNCERRQYLIYKRLLSELDHTQMDASKLLLSTIIQLPPSR